MNEKKKIILLSLVSVILVIGLIFACIGLVNVFKDNAYVERELSKKMYATVSEVGDDYIVIKPFDGESVQKITINTNRDYNTGDFIVLEYDDVMMIDDDKIEVIASKDDYIDTTSVSGNKETTTKKQTTIKTTTTTKASVKDKDSIVLDYVSETSSEIAGYEKLDKFKDTAKNGFIKIVDFIFYDGEIKGVTWDELSNSAKAKVVYYALKIDNKIDSKWPNYKEELSSKFKDVKAKLLAKYMDLTTSICEKHSVECEQTKSDFNDLKTSLNITWSLLKKAFSYGYDKTTTYLKNWYEIFSGK